MQECDHAQARRQLTIRGRAPRAEDEHGSSRQARVTANTSDNRLVAHRADEQIADHRCRWWLRGEMNPHDVERLHDLEARKLEGGSIDAPCIDVIVHHQHTSGEHDPAPPPSNGTSTIRSGTGADKGTNCGGTAS